MIVVKTMSFSQHTPGQYKCAHQVVVDWINQMNRIIHKRLWRHFFSAILHFFYPFSLALLQVHVFQMQSTQSLSIWLHSIARFTTAINWIMTLINWFLSIIDQFIESAFSFYRPSVMFAWTIEWSTSYLQSRRELKQRKNWFGMISSILVLFTRRSAENILTSLVMRLELPIKIRF